MTLNQQLVNKHHKHVNIIQDLIKKNSRKEKGNENQQTEYDR